MRPLLTILVIFCTQLVFGQVDLEYQIPSEEILKLADAPLPPSVRINSDGTLMVFLQRDRYKSIHELSKTELRLAGLRIDPATNSSSRISYYTDLTISDVGSGKVNRVSGLPENPRISNISWSPDETSLAFTLTTGFGVELWLLNVASKSCLKLTEDILNANVGRPYTWFRDSKALLVRVLPGNREALIAKVSNIPTGPRISVNEGQKAQNRTYQDLLKDKADEFNFKQLAHSDLIKVDLDATSSEWKGTDMYSSTSFSPDGKYVMLRTISQPFSYLVPYYRFPSKTIVYSSDGQHVKTLLDLPLIEELPKGFMAVRKGMRSLSWRADKPATLYWAEALDEGDPAIEVEFRDQVYEWDAPFNGTKRILIKVKNRYSGIDWCTDNLAFASDYWWNTRNAKKYQFNPSDPDEAPEIIQDRNYQDRYNDPGNFVSRRNKFGRYVLDLDGDNLYLTAAGYSEDGILPFVDKYNIKTGEKKRLWRAEKNEHLERIIRPLDAKEGLFLTRLESNTKYPNYFKRNIKTGSDPVPVTRFENPFKGLQSIHKEIIKYKREDGVDLSATLYLPQGAEKKNDMPMIMWAYPYEFKDKASAGQVTSSPNEFTYPWYGSPIFWVMKGYIVLDDAAFPIIGEGDVEPNDAFIKQLVANAKAGIDAVEDLGYLDRKRVAVGGHSYGAFMTANLLSHSNLFAAGIARSGAYNRTLTPFGFQSEERNYWEAPEIYYNMSPFMHADKMKSPLLLIHGEADNNSGTYPMQSERYFNALKGLGATARLVMLPKESHGYSSRESVLHMLWEQEEWLMKYLGQ